jgi:sarcosine/dimethylglycine N-methyltransferase
LRSWLGSPPTCRFLDVGSGVGGPARFLAVTYGGCRVTSVDLSPPFVDAARDLTERTGQSGQVSFQTASALELPFDDGRFATFDIVLTGGEPHYPVPWARTPATSFLFTAAATRKAIEAAGFRMLAWQDDTAAAKA